MLELTLRNFQGFARPQTVPLAPITLIFGPNSAGKSSIIRALLLIAQSLSLNSSGFQFVGNLVDLGSFENTVYKHDSSLRMAIGIKLRARDYVSPLEISGIEWTIGPEGSIESLQVSGHYLNDFSEDAWHDFDLKFEARTVTELPFREERFRDFESRDDAITRYFPVPKAILQLNRINLALAKNLEFLKSSYRKSQVSSPSRRNDSVELESLSGTDFSEFQKRVKKGLAEEAINFRDKGADLRFLTPVLESVAWARLASGNERERFTRPVHTSLAAELDNFVFKLRSAFMGLDHLGPLRVVPEKLVYVSKKNIKRSKDGDSLASILGNFPAIRERVSDLLYQATDKNFKLEWADIRADSKRAHLGKLGTLLVEDVRSGALLSFRDVGTGISQILPLLENIARSMKRQLEAASNNPSTRHRNATMHSIRATSKVLFLAEQPELHLHPRMQSFVGSLLSEFVSSDIKRHSQVIAETHSEAIIMRLQREIKLGRINSDDLSVIYVDRSARTKQNSVGNLPIDEFGNFLVEWPESFSDLRLREVFGK